MAKSIGSAKEVWDVRREALQLRAEEVETNINCGLITEEEYLTAVNTAIKQAASDQARFASGAPHVAKRLAEWVRIMSQEVGEGGDEPQAPAAPAAPAPAPAVPVPVPASAPASQPPQASEAKKSVPPPYLAPPPAYIAVPTSLKAAQAPPVAKQAAAPPPEEDDEEMTMEELEAELVMRLMHSP